MPVRIISDILGKSVVWNESERSVKTDNVTFIQNSNKYYINGTLYNLSGKCFIEDGSFFVPTRDFFNIFNIPFTWDGEHYSVLINNENISVPAHYTKYDYENDHIYWLSRIINAESEAEPMAGKIGVGNVVLNRVAHKDFPNTIYTVIFDKKYGVQYEPVINNTIYKTPSKESIKAAKFSLNGFNTVGKCLYFFNPVTATNSWIKENRTFYKTIGNHDFYI